MDDEEFEKELMKLLPRFLELDEEAQERVLGNVEKTLGLAGVNLDCSGEEQ